MRLWRKLASPKLAAALIAVLLGFSVVSVIIPQRLTNGDDFIEEWRASQPWIAGPAVALGMDRVFLSWPYWVLSALLVVNLALCTWRRVRARSTRPTLGRPPEDAIRIPVTLTPEEAAIRLGGGWRAAAAVVDGGVVCRTGRLGFAGSVVMHLGLIVLVVAGVLTGLTRFEGDIVLVEGVDTTDVRPSYLRLDRVPPLGNPFNSAVLHLGSMEFDYEGPVITDARAFMRASYNGRTWTHTARVNHPLHVGAKSFLLKDTGYSVGLSIIDPSGTARPDVLVNLVQSRPDGIGDSVSIGELDLGLLAVPDVRAPRGMPVAHKLIPVDPGVLVTATVGGRTLIADHLLRPGGSVDVDGWKLRLIEVRRWTRFNARLDYGIYVAYAGFLLVIAGFSVRALDPDVVVRVALADAEARIWAKARWGAGLADSAARTAAALLGGPAAETSQGGRVG